ncbi:GNAT family N-acetyltransferase [Shimia sp. R11_0]|uniref:GNAT family N-acetyltransferase n=1 Tax=Shimia sp. R11_0 TaxID=2821096 RepID=UPI001AD9633D|nr:GNAT family N-acetyltransferase [Shimia sp. R11_0]MBO9476542.1 GNAT family N-acetyltransferase [Shimia sp. R11_0]
MSDQTTAIEVVAGDPRDPQATALLQASHALMQELFDPEDNHYLSIDDLCIPSIQFFVAREGAQTLGCVALANKGSYGEIKSMFVDPSARGKGIAHKLMSQLDAAARAAQLTAIKLETGDKLKEAHGLYYAHGFEDCDPFGDYEANSSSIFMTKSLT